MISTAGRENFTSISGLVVEYIVAIDVTRVRFPADALFMAPGAFVAEAVCGAWQPAPVRRKRQGAQGASIRRSEIKPASGVRGRGATSKR